MLAEANSLGAKFAGGALELLLAKVGANRTPEWLADHVKNPKTHKPESTMPDFASKLNAEELKSVTDFMAGLK